MPFIFPVLATRWGGRRRAAAVSLGAPATHTVAAGRREMGGEIAVRRLRLCAAAAVVAPAAAGTLTEERWAPRVTMGAVAVVVDTAAKEAAVPGW